MFLFLLVLSGTNHTKCVVFLYCQQLGVIVYVSISQFVCPSTKAERCLFFIPTMHSARLLSSP